MIITSAYQEYALESFELDVCDYLLKPFRFARFLKAVNKAYELYQLKQAKIETIASPVTVKTESPKQLFIKSDKKHIQVELSDIYYLESYGNYVKVWLEGEFHLTPKTMMSFEAELPQNTFFRIHKSYLINRHFIDYIEGNFVLMKNGKQLPVGKNNRTTLKRFILS